MREIINNRECEVIELPISKQKVAIKVRMNHGENIEIKKITFDDKKIDIAKIKEGEEVIEKSNPTTFDEYIKPQINNDKVLVLCIERIDNDKKPSLDWINSLYEEDVIYIDNTIADIATSVENTKKK